MIKTVLKRQTRTDKHNTNQNGVALATGEKSESYPPGKPVIVIRRSGGPRRRCAAKSVAAVAGATGGPPPGRRNSLQQPALWRHRDGVQLALSVFVRTTVDGFSVANDSGAFARSVGHDVTLAARDELI